MENYREILNNQRNAEKSRTELASKNQTVNPHEDIEIVKDYLKRIVESSFPKNGKLGRSITANAYYVSNHDVNKSYFYVEVNKRHNGYYAPIKDYDELRKICSNEAKSPNDDLLNKLRKTFPDGELVRSRVEAGVIELDGMFKEHQMFAYEKVKSSKQGSNLFRPTFAGYKKTTGYKINGSPAILSKEIRSNDPDGWNKSFLRSDGIHIG